MARALCRIALVCIVLPACEVKVGGTVHAGSEGGSEGGSAGVGQAAGGGVGPGAGMGGSMPGGAAGATSGVPLLPARIRRLTNAEFDSSVNALLGVNSTYGQ